MDSPTTWQPILDLLGKITIAGGLFFILVGGYRKWWVWGYQLTDCEARAAKADADWQERVKNRDAELKTEIQEWKDSNRQTEAMLDRSLTLQEQRLRDSQQRGAVT